MCSFWIKRCLMHFQLCAQRQNITLSCWAVHPSNSPPTEVRPPVYGTLLTQVKPLSSPSQKCNFGTLLHQYTNLNVMMNVFFSVLLRLNAFFLSMGPQAFNLNSFCLQKNVDDLKKNCDCLYLENELWNPLFLLKRLQLQYFLNRTQ